MLIVACVAVQVTITGSDPLMQLAMALVTADEAWQNHALPQAFISIWLFLAKHVMTEGQYQHFHAAIDETKIPTKVSSQSIFSSLNPASNMHAYVCTEWQHKCAQMLGSTSESRAVEVTF